MGSRRIPCTSPGESTCYSMGPGSVLYLPPGYWHSVEPIAGDSISIDLRVGNVLHAKWICEAMFAGIMKEFGGDQHPVSAVGASDFASTPQARFSAGAEKQIAFVTKQLRTTLTQ